MCWCGTGVSQICGYNTDVVEIWYKYLSVIQMWCSCLGLVQMCGSKVLEMCRCLALIQRCNRLVDVVHMSQHGTDVLQMWFRLLSLEQMCEYETDLGLVQMCYRCVGVVQACHRFAGTIQIILVGLLHMLCRFVGLVQSSRIQVRRSKIISTGIKAPRLPSGCSNSGLMLLFCTQFVLLPVLLLSLLFFSHLDCGTPGPNVISVSIQAQVP